MMPRKSPALQAQPSGIATLDREIKMFLGIAPYAHDGNQAKGNAAFYQTLVDKYGGTVVTTTIQRLGKAAGIDAATVLTFGATTLGDAVDQGVRKYIQRIGAAPSQPRAAQGIRLVQVNDHDYAIVIRFGTVDVTLSRETNARDAKRVAAEWLERVARKVMEL